MSLAQGVPGTSVAPPTDVLEELAELRLRVAAQDRLIEAMLEENERIHVIRRHYESRRWYHLLEGTLVYRVAVVARDGLRLLAGALRGLGRSLPAAARRLVGGSGSDR